jgi:hypothetical protein
MMSMINYTDTNKHNQHKFALMKNILSNQCLRFDNDVKKILSNLKFVQSLKNWHNIFS